MEREKSWDRTSPLMLSPPISRYKPLLWCIRNRKLSSFSFFIDKDIMATLIPMAVVSIFDQYLRYNSSGTPMVDKPFGVSRRGIRIHHKIIPSKYNIVDVVPCYYVAIIKKIGLFSHLYNEKSQFGSSSLRECKWTNNCSLSLSSLLMTGWDSLPHSI